MTPDDEENEGVGDQGYVDEFLRSMGEFLDFEDDYGDEDDDKPVVISQVKGAVRL